MEVVILELLYNPEAINEASNRGVKVNTIREIITGMRRNQGKSFPVGNSSFKFFIPESAPLIVEYSVREDGVMVLMGIS